MHMYSFLPISNTGLERLWNRCSPLNAEKSLTDYKDNAKDTNQAIERLRNTLSSLAGSMPALNLLWQIQDPNLTIF